MSGPDTHEKLRRFAKGSDGTRAVPPAPDGLQVCLDGLYAHPDLSPLPRFNRDFETAIGLDERKFVEDTTESPWRKICQLSYKIKGMPHRGTGWFVGPRTIVTAGHCLLSDSSKTQDLYATDMKIAPGRAHKGSDAAAVPFGIVRSSRYSVHDNWADGRQRHFDIGCIHLDEDVDSRVGWFGYGVLSDADLATACVNVGGYPLKAPDKPQAHGMYPVFHNDNVIATRERRLYYATDTHSGQSGSPVWLRLSAQEPPVVIGIHAYGENDPDARKEGECNAATRINTEILRPD